MTRTHDPLPADWPTKFATLCASDIMQRDLITVHASDSLLEVQRVLTEARISGAPVLDDDERIVGILSMRDLLRRIVDDEDLPDGASYADFDAAVDDGETVAFRRSNAAEPCAGDIMATELACIDPHANLVQVAAAMAKAEVHRLLVADRQRFVGIVSTMDVLRALANLPPNVRS